MAHDTVDTYVKVALDAADDDVEQTPPPARQQEKFLRLTDEEEADLLRYAGSQLWQARQKGASPPWPSARALLNDVLADTYRVLRNAGRVGYLKRAMRSAVISFFRHPVHRWVSLDGGDQEEGDEGGAGGLLRNEQVMAALSGAPIDEQLISEQEELSYERFYRMARARLYELFQRDPPVLAIIVGKSLGLSPRDICLNAGMTSTDYQTAHRRLRRKGGKAASVLGGSMSLEDPSLGRSLSLNRRGRG